MPRSRGSRVFCEGFGSPLSSVRDAMCVGGLSAFAPSRHRYHIWNGRSTSAGKPQLANGKRDWVASLARASSHVPHNRSLVHCGRSVSVSPWRMFGLCVISTRSRDPRDPHKTWPPAAGPSVASATTASGEGRIAGPEGVRASTWQPMRALMQSPGMIKRMPSKAVLPSSGARRGAFTPPRPHKVYHVEYNRITARGASLLTSILTSWRRRSRMRSRNAPPTARSSAGLLTSR